VKFLIINADDFGYSRGINIGIVEVHRRGVVTSTSLMVNTVATEEAVAMAADLTELSVGLHVNFTNENDQLVDLEDPAACRNELHRQFDRFVQLMGRIPTHLDSQQHVHRGPNLLPVFRELADEHGLPLRESSPALYVGGFYAQWETGVSKPEHVSFEALTKILRDEVQPGVTELGCHPGYYDPEFEGVYHRDREYELSTLCDPRLRRLLQRLDTQLIGFHQLSEAVASCERINRRENAYSHFALGCEVSMQQPRVGHQDGSPLALRCSQELPRPATGGTTGESDKARGWSTGQVRFLIVNADDFGYSDGINAGIAAAHTHGIVTSTGLMVNTPATDGAVRMAAELPELSIGLHVNFTNENDRLVDLDDPAACRDELRRQFDRFVQLMGRVPTHLDSHQHVHRAPHLLPHFRNLAEEHGLPLRESSPVLYVGGFYAQWQYGISQPEYVSIERLIRILRDEVRAGITELGCHPGYYDPNSDFLYHRDREHELRTLCDPRVCEFLHEAGIKLIGFRQLHDEPRGSITADRGYTVVRGTVENGKVSQKAEQGNKS
jgi:predicted glycoside hydrolase/deacetylase ChbG (UPF0249 family)